MKISSSLLVFLTTGSVMSYCICHFPCG